MKALIVGLGSMGKRRIRNLKHLGIHHIIGYDIRTDRNEYARNTYNVEILDYVYRGDGRISRCGQ